MGSAVPPDPGDFELGDDCTNCTSGSHPIFLPGKTPKFVKVEIFTGATLIDTKILTQDPVLHCIWNHTTGGSVTYNWWVDYPEWTQLRRWWLTDSVFHQSFIYFAEPACLTKMPNQLDPGDPDYLGDSAKVTWGEGIKP